MAAIVKVCLRDSQKRQTEQTGPKKSSLNSVCMVRGCVFRGQQGWEMSTFFLQWSISICIISIPHEQQRKEGDAHTKPKLTREQWWPEGSFCRG